MLVKILLLNENPVVTKLVTLSAQKTSDELDIITNIEDLKSQNYDLFAIDDTLYKQEIFDEIKKKTNFSKSLYICSRDAEEVKGFTNTIRKPFLPTDLVELFANLDSTQNQAKEVDAQDELDLTESFDIELDSKNDGELLDVDIEDIDMDELSDATELVNLDELDDIGQKNQIEKLDDFDDLDLEDDDIELSDLEDDDSEDIDLSELSEDKTQGILDKDEVEEVQNLLEETEEDDDLEDFDEELDTDEFNLDDLELDDLELDSAEESEEESKKDDEFNLDDLENFDFEDDKEELSDEPDIKEPEEEKIEDLEPLSELEELDALDEVDEELEEIGEDFEELEEVEQNKIEQELDDLEEDIAEDDELNIDDISDDELESTIEGAVLGLSKEDLESELDEETFMDIDMGDDLDLLNTREIKLAIGEEVSEEIENDESQSNPDELEEDSFQEMEIEEDTEIASDDAGVESLKKLLKALSDKDVAASLKGMKININITLGEK